MRNVPAIQILAISIGLVLGCSRPSSEHAIPAAPATLTPAAPETISQTCNPPKRQCPNCTGGTICALRCPLCAPIEAPSPEPALEMALTCKPPERRCLSCTGELICARFCPECPAPVTQPEPTEVAALTPVGEQCGGVICGAGLHCCNPSCNICTPKGVECTQQSCN